MKSGEQALGHVLAVVHRVTEGDGVGSFLHSNSEEFEVKMHQKLNYQNLLHFAFTTLSAENSERTRSFLKTTFRAFAKGRGLKKY